MSSRDEDLKDIVKKERKEKEETMRKEIKSSVNREETCPLLLRVFTSSVRHNDITDYERGRTPENEIQIYTWMDATLKELTGLIKEVNPDARRRNTYFNFRLVYYDLRAGRYCFRDIGSTVAGAKGVDDDKILGEVQFTIGDYMDVSISPPNQRNDRMDYNRRGGMGGMNDRFGGGGRRRDMDIRERDIDVRDRRGDDRRDRGGDDRRDRGGDDRRDRGGDNRRERGGRDSGRGRDRSRSPRDRSS
eukprot:TRINITY_DN16379_c0_g1_i2.p1 TRINITY_DN16379_c0_g1~~TRINITY_DN16379_c0_g1_i2.p1  ORF type:complete len:246 (+),score=81.12 TRINITY_DN16379_c0_g1_i2:70-807(+)